jgi:hypothetical protein
MASIARKEFVRQRSSAGPSPDLQRLTISSDVPLDTLGPGIETALGYFRDPSLPVVWGIGLGALGGLPIVGVTALLLWGSVTPEVVRAIAPLVFLVGCLLGGLAGGLGGLLVVLTGQRPGLDRRERLSSE